MDKKAYNKQWRERKMLDPEWKERERIRCKKKQQDNPDRHWLASLKSRAKRAGIPFDEDMSDIVIPEYCPILGILLQRDPDSILKWNSPSLDKIVPSLGYIKGNRWVISNRANTIKNDATFEELILIGKWAEQQVKDKEYA